MAAIAEVVVSQFTKQSDIINNFEICLSDNSMLKPSSTMSSLPRVVKAANTVLAPNFKPGEHDVVCSRGTRVYNLVGNRNFRQVVDDHIKVYTRASTRAEKSVIIIRVVDIVRRRSPLGGFIRFCKKTKRYLEIGDARAREKVGHAFREAISSSTSKDAGGWQRYSHGVRSTCYSLESKEEKQQTATTASSIEKKKNLQQFFDKPLPVVTLPQRHSQLNSISIKSKKLPVARQSWILDCEWNWVSTTTQAARGTYLFENDLEDWPLLGANTWR